jgi:hypothetical protein
VALRIGKGLLIGLGATILVCAANHVEYAVRSRSAGAAGADFSVIVHQEEGAAGHRTIGVAEGKLTDPSEARVLRFSTLAAWDYDAARNPPCPGPIAALSGSKVTAVGFMYPLESGTQVRTFCLLRSTQTCCYGPRPQYNQYLLVEMDKAVRFERLAPVIVEGKFFAGARPEDGYIYRLEGTSARPADGEETEIDAAQASRAAGLKLFDISMLEALRPPGEGPSPAPPPELVTLDGQRLVLDGFCVGQTRGSPPGVIVGRAWWDGVAQGTPPDLFNAVKVFLTSERELPSRWKDRVAFTGTLHVTRDPKDWPAEGVVSLQAAVRGVPGQGGRSGDSRAARPYIPVIIEIIALAGFLAAAGISTLLRKAPSDA